MLYTSEENFKSKTDYGRAYFTSIQYLIRYFMRWLLANCYYSLRVLPSQDFPKSTCLRAKRRRDQAQQPGLMAHPPCTSVRHDSKFSKEGKLSLWLHETLISLFIHIPTDGPRWSCTIASLCLPVYSLFSFAHSAGGEQTKATPQPTHTHHGDQLGETVGGGAIRYVLGKFHIWDVKWFVFF